MIIIHRIARARLIVLAAAALMLGACGKKSKTGSDAATGKPPVSQLPLNRAGDTAATEKFTVETPDGKRLLTFHAGSGMKIELGEGAGARVLRGTMRDNGKRKYEVEGGPLVAEVKSDADAFKLRTVDGKLLWKVKLDDDKIKISDNEQNENPYVIKMRDDGAKVEENDNAIGEVKFYPDRGRVKVKGADDTELFDGNAARMSVMYAPLLMKRIPDTERSIIMAEIAARGR
jgi:hypothetical protein